MGLLAIIPHLPIHLWLSNFNYNSVNHSLPLSAQVQVRTACATAAATTTAATTTAETTAAAVTTAAKIESVKPILRTYTRGKSSLLSVKVLFIA